MSAFSGRQQRGAIRAHREAKRLQAEDRNGRTPLERTAKFRRDRAVVEAAVAEVRTRKAAS